jgi:NAD(P)-dependent dehydrogenase (short-subunit alcohol dehydrogenase family)
VSETGLYWQTADPDTSIHEQILQKIRSTGGEAHFINSDTNSEVAVQALIDGVLERYGRLDGAVNNDSIALVRIDSRSPR